MPISRPDTSHHAACLALVQFSYIQLLWLQVEDTPLLWYGLERPVITSKMGNWSVFVLLGWRFVFGIIMRRDGREPAPFRCHRDSGNNTAASLLRLGL